MQTSDKESYDEMDRGRAAFQWFHYELQSELEKESKEREQRVRQNARRREIRKIAKKSQASTAP